MANNTAETLKDIVSSVEETANINYSIMLLNDGVIYIDIKIIFIHYDVKNRRSEST